MNDNSDLLPNLVHEDAFEVQMRGYSRRQVDEFIARCRSQIRDLEQRLARALDDGEELRRELAATRQQALGAKPAHEEVSERIAQILKLADDEARSQQSKAHEDITRQRNDAQTEAEKIRTEAREQAERMLTAAQEQAERAITSARAEAEKTVTGARNEAEKTLTAARTEAERTTTEARKKSESALASSKAQAKKALDEATARATAIHDGAERRLNLLSTRHAETIKRLTDILDGVSGLVAAETARMSLEDEVDQATAKAVSAGESNGAPRPAGETAGSATAARPATAAGPRPAAPGGPARPTPPSQATPGQPTQPQAQSPAGQSPAGQSSPGQSQERPGHAPGRARVIDTDEKTEGVRIRPGGDNLRPTAPVPVMGPGPARAGPGVAG
jgi:cell division septum initiation protein DivIVA